MKGRDRCTIFAAGRAIRLLERFEDELLLVLGNSDTGVGNRNLDGLVGIAEHRMGRAPAAASTAYAKRDAALRGELEGVGQEVEDDLLKPFLVGPDVMRELGVELDVEVEALVGSELAEGPFHVLLQVDHRHLADLDRHRSGFDLRKVEDVVDEIEKV